MGHQQLAFIKSDWKSRYSHGGVLRKKQSGRGQRPLSSKDPLHVVFKAERACLRERSLRGYRSFSVVQKLIKKYAFQFHVKLEQISIQRDHIHILIRCSKRSHFHHFFRVLSGQIAQILLKEGLLRKIVTDTAKTTQGGTKLWKYRPFSRVIRSWRAYQIVKDYIQLNEKEARGEIKYNSQRLKGLSAGEWQILWV